MLFFDRKPGVRLPIQRYGSAPGTSVAIIGRAHTLHPDVKMFALLKHLQERFGAVVNLKLLVNV
jgi:hypothetical protein